MGYLDNSTIIVDSILTKKGRELMSQGQLNITKFALADDEINYALYDPTHPSGSDYYASAIQNLPILEAFPDESKLMKSLIVTRTDGDPTVEVFVDVGVSEYSIFLSANSSFAPKTVGRDQIEDYTVLLKDSKYVTILSDYDSSEPVINRTTPTLLGYGIQDPRSRITDPKIINPGITDPKIINPGITDPKIINPGITDPGTGGYKFGVGSITKKGTSFTLVAKTKESVPATFTTWSTQITITGNDSGKTKIIPVTIKKR